MIGTPCVAAFSASDAANILVEQVTPAKSERLPKTTARNRRISDNGRRVQDFARALSPYQFNPFD